MLFIVGGTAVQHTAVRRIVLAQPRIEMDWEIRIYTGRTWPWAKTAVALPFFPPGGRPHLDTMSLHPYTLAHETGHFVWSCYLAHLQPAWDVWWEANRVKMPSEYARSNAAEGWGVCLGALYWPREFPRWPVAHRNAVRRQMEAQLSFLPWPAPVKPLPAKPKPRRR